MKKIHKDIIWILLIIIVGTIYFTIIGCEANLTTPNKVKEVVITIDDAPIQNTFDMLKVLKKHNVQATFFCVGEYIEKDELHLADSIAKYHILANHTYSHLHLSEKSLFENYDKEILYNQIIIDSINLLYSKPLNNYFRAPYSAILDCQQDTLMMRGFKMCWWDCASEDWDPSISVKEIVTHNMDYIRSNDKTILLFHLSNNSVAALDSMLTIFEIENIKIKNLDY